MSFTITLSDPVPPSPAAPVASRTRCCNRCLTSSLPPVLYSITQARAWRTGRSPGCKATCSTFLGVRYSHLKSVNICFLSSPVSSCPSSTDRGRHGCARACGAPGEVHVPHDAGMRNAPLIFDTSSARGADAVFGQFVFGTFLPSRVSKESRCSTLHHPLFPTPTTPTTYLHNREQKTE